MTTLFFKPYIIIIFFKNLIRDYSRRNEPGLTTKRHKLSNGKHYFKH
jgi:hypothetical protein